MSKVKPVEWRKHPYVLLVATITQLEQMALTLLAVAFGPLLARRLGIPPISFLTLLGMVVIILGLWTTFHLVGELGSKVDVSNIEKTPLSRRVSLAAKLKTPLQRSLAWAGILSSLALALLTATALAMGSAFYAWFFIASYYLSLAFWFLIEVEDWKNDKYVLTEDRIIDINRIPVIYERRNEAPLAKVQNASFTRQGIGKFLDFGNVRVDTAALQAPIIFENVSRPDLIQEAIFSQIDALNERERATERQRRGDEATQWFSAYHTLAGGIRDIEYAESVAPGKPILLRWAVQGPPEREYWTSVEWDVESRLTGGEYACQALPAKTAGISSGLHSATIDPPSGATALYFRIVVKFALARPIYSSPERLVKILATLPV